MAMPQVLFSAHCFPSRKAPCYLEGFPEHTVSPPMNLHPWPSEYRSLITFVPALWQRLIISLAGPEIHQYPMGANGV